MNKKDKCLGNPEGHIWIKDTEQPSSTIAFLYGTTRKRFGKNKGTILVNGKDKNFGWSKSVILSIGERFYCSKCRNHTTDILEVNNIDKLLAEGWAVYVNDKMILPELTRKEYLK